MDPRFSVKFHKPVTRLFVKGLNYKTTEEELRELFSKYGKVVTVIIPIMRSGKKSGNAIVGFSKQSEAENAKKEMHKADFMGRYLEISDFMEKPPGETRPRRRENDYYDDRDRDRRNDNDKSHHPPNQDEEIRNREPPRDERAKD